MFVIGAADDSPESNRDQNDSTSLPAGVFNPIPVTTTLGRPR
jgi:hypothetical protein